MEITKRYYKVITLSILLMLVASVYSCQKMMHKYWVEASAIKEVSFRSETPSFRQHVTSTLINNLIKLERKALSKIQH